MSRVRDPQVRSCLADAIAKGKCRPSLKTIEGLSTVPGLSWKGLKEAVVEFICSGGSIIARGENRPCDGFPETVFRMKIPSEHCSLFVECKFWHISTENDNEVEVFFITAHKSS